MARPAFANPLGLSAAVLALVFGGGVCAQTGEQSEPVSGASQLLTVGHIFHDKAFDLGTVVPSKWLGDGDHYTTVEISTAVQDGYDIVRHDARSGERNVKVSARQLIPEGQERPLEIKDYAWSDDGQFALISTNTKKFRRYESLGDYWLLKLATGKLRQVGADAEPSTLMYARFSPDSRHVAYVRENNLYVESVEGGSARQLTRDGSELVVNGTGDWVNEEEFGLRLGFKWSPDSRRICYWQFDTEGVGTFYMMNDTGDVYSQPIPLQYPKVGSTNSAVRVGVVELESARTTWIELPGDPRQNYVPRMDWADSSDEVLLQYVNRRQNRNQVMLAGATDGSARVILTETDDAWIDIHDDVKWLADGESFTWLSDRDGWRHLYRVSRDGSKVTLLTPGDFDIIEVSHIDTTNGFVYYLASPEDNAARYLFRSPLGGPARVERLTPVGPSSVHAYDISPDSRWAFHTASTLRSPPRVDFVALPDHRSLRTVLDNQKVVDALAATPQGATEFFRVVIEDGVELDGWMMKPHNFDPTQQYPLLMYVYSEPAGQTVINRWRSDRHAWHLLLTQQGYIVASVDSRGTPGPRGRAWRKSIYGQIGILASEDQARAVRALLAERPYLDPGRVGSWGWSGGGQMTLNALFKYPEIYQTGIALSFVSDQRLYDTIYQERYMGLLEDNEEGYVQGSPITHAAGLEGNLLVIHGTADDNVHYQSSVQLIDRLIGLNKTFTFMPYPDRSHSIDEKPNTKRHLYGLMTRFLLENLPPGPRSAAVQ